MTKATKRGTRAASTVLAAMLLAAMLLAAMLLAVMLVTAAPAAAQPRQGRGGPRVIQLDEIRIEGRVQKPNAFYILNRSNLGYEVLDLRTTFVNEIIRTVQDEPF